MNVFKTIKSTLELTKSLFFFMDKYFMNLERKKQKQSGTCLHLVTKENNQDLEVDNLVMANKMKDLSD
jgi:hypothetical protein